MQNVCDGGKFTVPLTVDNFNEMSIQYKMDFVNMIYKNIGELYKYRIINDFRLFSYLFDNCTLSVTSGLQIGMIIVMELQQRIHETEYRCEYFIYKPLSISFTSYIQFALTNNLFIVSKTNKCLAASVADGQHIREPTAIGVKRRSISSERHSGYWNNL